MKNRLKLICIVPVLLALLMAACSSPADDTANQNAAPAANSNPAAPPPVAQTAPPPAPPASPNPLLTPPPVPIQPPALPSEKSKTQNANAAPANPPNAQATDKAAAGKTRAPKLAVVTNAKALDFGKQPQDKTLIRAIQIKNAGTAELKIENVAPG